MNAGSNDSRLFIDPLAGVEIDGYDMVYYD
jgi:hypothetical protein